MEADSTTASGCDRPIFTVDWKMEKEFISCSYYHSFKGIQNGSITGPIL